MAAVLALLASVVWGTADFLGGTAARRLRPFVVVAISQSLALVGVGVVALATQAWTASTGYIGWALLAAGAGVIALTAFYAALASGRMGVVAPIAATGVVVPLAVGLASGDRPSGWQITGVVAAVLGVMLASGPSLNGGATERRPLLLALVAALGFGAVIVCVARGAKSSTVMTLVSMRAASVVVFVVAGLWLARRSADILRPELSVRDVALLGVIGGGDVGANALFAVASTRGSLAMVSVLSSLYPAATALLARLVHGELLTRVQQLGVAATLAGVALIASGGGV